MKLPEYSYTRVTGKPRISAFWVGGGNPSSSLQIAQGNLGLLLVHIQDGGQADEWYSANVHCSWKSNSFSSARPFSWSGRNWICFRLELVLFARALEELLFCFDCLFIARS